MKKFLIAAILMFVVVLGAFAQTYYYEYVESVDANGVRSKLDYVKNFYITITKNSCYVSDEKGLKITLDNATLGNAELGGGDYAYQGEQNNLYVFVFKESQFSGRMEGMKWVSDPVADYYLYFSKDYKRINARIYWHRDKKWGYKTNVFQQATPPSSAPSQFY